METLRRDDGLSWLSTVPIFERAMRRVLLHPPRAPEVALSDPMHADAPLPVNGPFREMPHDPLGAPHRAERRARRWFDPAKGWLRVAERQASQLLSKHVFPRIPGMRLPYGRILDRQLHLSEMAVALPGLPQAFDGTRILLMTDLHAGPFVSRQALERAIGRLAALEPDLILIGGDLVTAASWEFDDLERPLRTLRAPLGVFAVLGNHDHYAGDIEPIILRIQTWGLDVLHNRATTLRRNGSTLSLAGVDDWLVGRPDLDAALIGTVPPVILLSHNPDAFFDAADRGVALTLAGHTHAGQIRLPGLPVIVRQSRYRLDEGRYRYGLSELVVSRGIGATGLPWRSWCPPEAVLIELRARGG